MSDYADLLADLKEHRRQLVDHLSADMDPEVARTLALTHTAILAVEAVMAEPEPATTGPLVEFGEDGWPKA